MVINVRNPEAERLARQVAEVSGETLTGAITVALRERLERLRRTGKQPPASARLARLRAISADAAPRWRTDAAATDHASGLYDERGLPR